MVYIDVILVATLGYYDVEKVRNYAMPQHDKRVLANPERHILTTAIIGSESGDCQKFEKCTGRHYVSQAKFKRSCVCVFLL